MRGEAQKSVRVSAHICLHERVRVCVHTHKCVYGSLSPFTLPVLHLARVASVTSSIGHSIELHVPLVFLLALSRENSWNAPRCRKQCSPEQLGRMNRTESERFRFYFAFISRDRSRGALASANFFFERRKSKR